MYTNGYAAIREDPTFKPTEKETDWKEESQKHANPRLTLEQRNTRIQEKIAAFKAGAAAEAEAEDDDDDLATNENSCDADSFRAQLAELGVSTLNVPKAEAPRLLDRINQVRPFVTLQSCTCDDPLISPA